MTRWVLRLYPAWFRARYGDELADLVNHSDHRPRDLLNVAVSACRVRWENRMTGPLRHLANAFVIVTVFVLGYVVNDLEHGVSEIGDHWWSSLALAITVLAVVGRVAVEAVHRRHDRPAAR